MINIEKKALNFILNHLKSIPKSWDYPKHDFTKREDNIFNIRVKVFINYLLFV